MYKHRVKNTILSFFSSLLLIACGNLETMYTTSNEVYQVNARVDGSTLDECALIYRDSWIHPYFITSVAQDPDVQGLTIFIKTPEGETVSGSIRYNLVTNGTAETENTGGRAETAGDTEKAYSADPEEADDPSAYGTVSGDSDQNEQTAADSGEIVALDPASADSYEQVAAPPLGTALQKQLLRTRFPNMRLQIISFQSPKLPADRIMLT
jgi:hypothetical protein